VRTGKHDGAVDGAPALHAAEADQERLPTVARYGVETARRWAHWLPSDGVLGTSLSMGSLRRLIKSADKKFLDDQNLPVCCARLIVQRLNEKAGANESSLPIEWLPERTSTRWPMRMSNNGDEAESCAQQAALVRKAARRQRAAQRPPKRIRRDIEHHSDGHSDRIALVDAYRTSRKYLTAICALHNCLSIFVHITMQRVQCDEPDATFF
jgi:hypothetical protein